MIQPLWITVWSLLKKLKIDLPYDLEIPLLSVYLKKTVNSKTCMHPSVCCSTIYNSQNMEATKMSISRGVDKDTVDKAVRVYNGVLLSRKNG